MIICSQMLIIMNLLVYFLMILSNKILIIYDYLSILLRIILILVSILNFMSIQPFLIENHKYIHYPINEIFIMNMMKMKVKLMIDPLLIK